MVARQVSPKAISLSAATVEKERNQPLPMNGFHLESHGIQVKRILRNASPAELYEEAIRHESDTRLSSAGALMAYSGPKTGRSPKDKRVVRNPASEEEVWVGQRQRAPG